MDSLPLEIIREVFLFVGYDPSHFLICKDLYELLPSLLPVHQENVLRKYRVELENDESKNYIGNILNLFAYHGEWNLFLLIMELKTCVSLEIAHLYGRYRIARYLFLHMFNYGGQHEWQQPAEMYYHWKCNCTNSMDYVVEQYLNFYHRNIDSNSDFNKKFIGYMTQDMIDHLRDKYQDHSPEDAEGNETFLALQDSYDGDTIDHIVLTHYGADTTTPYYQCIAELILDGTIDREKMNIERELREMMYQTYVTPQMIQANLLCQEIVICYDDCYEAHANIEYIHPIVVAECIDDLGDINESDKGKQSMKKQYGLFY